MTALSVRSATIASFRVSDSCARISACFDLSCRFNICSSSLAIRCTWTTCSRSCAGSCGAKSPSVSPRRSSSSELLSQGAPRKTSRAEASIRMICPRIIIPVLWCLSSTSVPRCSHSHVALSSPRGLSGLNRLPRSAPAATSGATRASDGPTWAMRRSSSQAKRNGKASSTPLHGMCGSSRILMTPDDHSR